MPHASFKEPPEIEAGGPERPRARSKESIREALAECADEHEALVAEFKRWQLMACQNGTLELHADISDVMTKPEHCQGQQNGAAQQEPAGVQALMGCCGRAGSGLADANGTTGANGRKPPPASGPEERRLGYGDIIAQKRAAMRDRLQDCADKFDDLQEEYQTALVELKQLRQKEGLRTTQSSKATSEQTSGVVGLRSFTLSSTAKPTEPKDQSSRPPRMVSQCTVGSYQALSASMGSEGRPSEGRPSEVRPCSKDVALLMPSCPSSLRPSASATTPRSSSPRTSKVSRPSQESAGGPAMDKRVSSSSGGPYPFRWCNIMRRVFKKIVQSYTYKMGVVFCLFTALCGGALWQIFSVPDDPGNVVLDSVMMIVMCLFTLEMIVNIIIDNKHYPCSFFFLMDLIGTASMVLEVSFLLGEGNVMMINNADVNPQFLRTARTAKVGARVGRLFKIVKCISLLYRDRDKVIQKSCEARVISARLMLKLSTRVSFLVIILVLVLPLLEIFQYPNDDHSLLSWIQRLEVDYARAYKAANASAAGIAGDPEYSFAHSVEALAAFYSANEYFPFRLEGYPEVIDLGDRVLRIPGSSSLLNEKEPVRLQNVMRVALDSGIGCLVERPGCQGGERAAIHFNFERVRILESIMDIVTIVILLFLMVGGSFDLSKIIDTMLVKPLERMLGMVNDCAAKILEQVIESRGMDAEVFSDQGNKDMPEANQEYLETDVVEDVMKKLAKLFDLSVKQNVASEADINAMDHESKGVMVELMHVKMHQAAKSMSFLDLDMEFAGSLAKLPVPVVEMDSFELNVLELDSEGLANVVLHIFMDSPLNRITGRAFTKLDQFVQFHDKVRGEYKANPYHCYAHACDVLHTVYRLLVLTQAEKWMGSIEPYSILIAALAHDIGHMGRANPFLVETRHELALRYNDKSPLENMHCARLFDICKDEDCDIFSLADEEAKKKARRVCISAILHTDNVHHFEMVKQISTTYEIVAEICEAQACARSEIAPRYKEEVLRVDTAKWLDLFLHVADVSNPLKPFNICMAWADRVLEEFFDQGDEEKMLGLPVGMLNDRDKVNRPGSQHGFINFMVAPLVLNTVKLFPMLHMLAGQMASNLEEWRNLWVDQQSPPYEEVEKRDAEVLKVRLQAEELRLRARNEKREAFAARRLQTGSSMSSASLLEGPTQALHRSLSRISRISTIARPQARRATDGQVLKSTRSWLNRSEAQRKGRRPST